MSSRRKLGPNARLSQADRNSTPPTARHRKRGGPCEAWWRGRSSTRDPPHPFPTTNPPTTASSRRKPGSTAQRSAAGVEPGRPSTAMVRRVRCPLNHPALDPGFRRDDAVDEASQVTHTHHRHPREGGDPGVTRTGGCGSWIPACAGMTVWKIGRSGTKSFARRRLRTKASPSLFLRLIPVASSGCILLSVHRTDGSRRERRDGPAGGEVSRSPWAVRWSAGNPSPIAHVFLKSRAPRRLRLYYNYTSRRTRLGAPSTSPRPEAHDRWRLPLAPFSFADSPYIFLEVGETCRQSGVSHINASSGRTCALMGGRPW
jgi:hypothetical protein